MTATAEVCTCSQELIVIGKHPDGTPVTSCPHCDVPIEQQTDHPEFGCLRCYRYDRHALRIFPPTG